MAVDSACVELNASFLIETGLAAVGHGLVERLEVFERGIGLVRCSRAEVFVKPPMRGTPMATSVPLPIWLSIAIEPPMASIKPRAA